MSAFFSGTDTETLREEGNDRNHFVSLIVNNAGTYTAAITRRLSTKKVVNTTYTYKTFDDTEKTGCKSVEVMEEVIAYNMLTIIKEGEVTKSFQEIDERLEAIKANKAAAVSTKSSIPPTYYNGTLPFPHSIYPKKNVETNEPYQATLFDEEFMESEPPRQFHLQSSVDPNDEIIDIDINLPTSLIESLSLQLITGSVAISDTSKIDPKKWAGKMIALFDKRFNNDMVVFGLWAEIFSEFLLTNFIPKKYLQYEEEYQSALAQALYMTLDNLPKNKYIESIQDALTIWMK